MRRFISHLLAVSTWLWATRGSGHHTPSLKRKDRRTTEVALEERKSAHTTGALAVPVQPQLWNILCNANPCPSLEGLFYCGAKSGRLGGNLAVMSNR